MKICNKTTATKPNPLTFGDLKAGDIFYYVSNPGKPVLKLRNEGVVYLSDNRYHSSVSCRDTDQVILLPNACLMLNED